MTLQELKARVRIPVIASPMFIVSYPELVIAQCKAGIIGSFPALNARPAHVLEDWLERITSELAEYDRQNPDRPSAPFAVNQIVHKTNDRLHHDMKVCVKYKVPLVITSLGAQPEINDAVTLAFEQSITSGVSVQKAFADCDKRINDIFDRKKEDES